jgi:hypothetical protein
MCSGVRSALGYTISLKVSEEVDDVETHGESNIWAVLLKVAIKNESHKLWPVSVGSDKIELRSTFTPRLCVIL